MSIVNPAGGPNDPRIGPGQAQTDSTGRRREGRTVEHGTEAARVSLSDHAAISQTRALAQAENLAAAEGSVDDIDRASELVKQLSAQISQQRPQGFAAQGNINPRAALNLLS
jgi:hypothetical protein